MARLFPLRTETPSREGRPRVVDLADEEADAVFGALASTTARQIYARLNDEPGTASDVAEAIDSSIQNVRYHLEKLENAGLVEVVDTWYSSRGNEMSVYAAADGPLIVTSDEGRADRLREALSRFLGGVAVLGGASLLLQYGASNWFDPAMGADDAGFATSSGDGDASSRDGADGGAGDESGGSDDAGAFDAPEELDGERSAAADDQSDADAGAESAEGDAPTADDGGGPDYDAAPDGGDDGGILDAATDAGAETLEAFATLVSPGLAFFLGGLLVLTAVLVWWYWYRPSRMGAGPA